MHHHPGQKSNGRCELISEFERRRANQHNAAFDQRRVEAVLQDVVEAQMRNRPMIDPVIDRELTLFAEAGKRRCDRGMSG